MTRHTIKSALTRLVVIVSIAASIGLGSVGIGGTTEVAAMPVNCDRLLAASDFNWAAYKYWRHSTSSYGQAQAAHYMILSTNQLAAYYDAGC